MDERWLKMSAPPPPPLPPPKKNTILTRYYELLDKIFLFFCDFQGRWKIGIKNHQKHRKIQRSCQAGNKCSRENQRKGPRWAVVSASLYSWMIFSAESSMKCWIELSASVDLTTVALIRQLVNLPYA